MMQLIQEYVDGISRGLEKVTPKDGRAIVVRSIKEQVNRLARMADGNRDWYKEFFGEFLEMMEQRHNITTVSHEQLMRDFDTFLDYGLDAVDHFDDGGCWHMSNAADEKAYKVCEIIGEEITEWGNWYETREPVCDNCDEILQYNPEMERCPYCGVKLDWSGWSEFCS